MEEKQKSYIPSLPKYAKPISDKLLSHVQSDYFIEKSGLEGNYQDDSLLYMVHILKQLAGELRNDKLAQLISEFEDCFDLVELLETKKVTAEEVTSKIEEKIKKLQPGDRIFIPGGWRGRAGHAMFYSIEKQQDGKYAFLTFNTGGGINFFHDTQIDLSYDC